MTSSPMEKARDAVERAEWQQALDHLGAAQDTVSAEALELRATAAYGNGDFEASVSAWEDLYALLIGQGEQAEAARAASMIAMYLMMDTGLMAPVRGWLRRAEGHLHGHDEAPAHALIATVRTYERFMCGDMDAAREQSALAIELGTRLGVQPAVVIGRVAAARVTIFDGRVQEGLDQLDEIGVMLMSGEVDPLTTGMMYCELICAAQGLALHDMASEWTDVMERWRHGAAFGGINGRCRVHRAEMLRVSGPCDAAEAEALGACDELRPWMRREFGWPLAELGNIRLRKGDLEGAEEAFMAAHEHAWSPHPGLALLRLERGDIESAAALVGDAIAHPIQIPSKERPPFGDLRQAPLLDAQVEIAAAAGDLDTAERATQSLQSIAESYPSASLAACAALARGRTALMSRDLAAAARYCASAMAAWAEIGAPFEAAVARTVLGAVHHESGNAEAARMEWTAAQAAFKAYGAERKTEQVGRLLDVAKTRSAEAPTSAKATFSLDGDTRTLSFGGKTVLMRDLKGLRYIERLLESPDREFHVLDLVAVEQGTLPTGRNVSPEADEYALDDAGGLAAIDQEAREAYRRRLAEVEEDIEEALSLNDLGRSELAQRDRDYLIAELTRAVGLGGRHRAVGGNAEKARTAVTRAVRYALARVAEHHSQLADHLSRSIRTGTYCSYAPDPVAAVDWTR